MVKENEINKLGQTVTVSKKKNSTLSMPQVDLDVEEIDNNRIGIIAKGQESTIIE